MKTQLTKPSIIALVALLASSAFAQVNVNQESKVYQVEKRLSDYTRPITFTPTKAAAVNGAITENIMTTTQNI